jgi:hypothetical protein
MTAQGSSDGGTTWHDLGRLMPSTAPKVNEDGTVTLGPASFFFQNPAGTAVAPGVLPAGQANCPATGTAPVTEVRVVSGPASTPVASTPVLLAGLPAPPENGGPGASQISGITATAVAGGGTAAPRADGVDQAGLALQLASDGGAIPDSDPRYGLVYYRYDGSYALVTGLYHGDSSDYTAVGPYAANGSAPSVHLNYLVSTDTSPRYLDPIVNDSGTQNPDAPTQQKLSVQATSNTLGVGGTGTNGFGITGCATGCTLAAPTATGPALYQAGDVADNGPPMTGLLLQAQAITSRDSLPLLVGTGGTHQLGSEQLMFILDQSQAQLEGTSQFWSSDSVDTALVTAGQLVTVSVPVGGSGHPAGSPARRPTAGKAGR